MKYHAHSPGYHRVGLLRLVIYGIVLALALWAGVVVVLVVGG